MQFKRIVWALAASFICLTLSAQNNTNSPYSRYGYGELRDLGFGKSQAMGGIGIGLRDHTTINPANPASYSAMDSLTFLFDFGVSGVKSSFSEAGTHASTFNGGLDYVAFQFPLAKWMAAGIGLVPYSVAGYNFTTQGRLKSITGTAQDLPGRTDTVLYLQSFNGNGSISQLYGGISVKLGKHLALGVNANYLFGSNNYYKSLSIADSSDASHTFTSTAQSLSLHVSTLSLRYGLQYTTNIGKVDGLTIGAMFEPKVGMHGHYTENTYGIDTVTIANAESSNYFETPTQFGFGATYMHDNRITLGADFLMQQWANSKYFGKTDSLKNRIKFSLGGEYINNPYGQSYWQRMRFRFGANYSTSYINVNGYSPTMMSISCGFGFPLRTSRSIVNTTFEYGIIGKSSPTTLRENYFRFSLDLTLDELWFFKREL
ncbi:hypothetical protein [Microbacter margulisiae]|uniref:Long-chain fatty acid transport protein n=1 Tax=Microbacter margulisiae TaxID=1350067 RepID=A0A7W5DNZ6_9PORP|nr:hypothetical protein [Microbacter margulisiae]MBB3186415.1 hypothetical protein [Microbacter margulisiae]